MFQKFMGNKDFHPGSYRNIKKKWEVEEKAKQDRQKQDDLRRQYQKEQDMYTNKEAMGKANPLNFMYEPPPGFKKEPSKEEKKEENEKLKFDWQRTDRAPPREEYAKSMNVTDQPFGVEVRNVKCIKCGKWGHINTDRICPLFGKSKDELKGEDSLPSKSLTDLDTAEDGFIFKQCVLDRRVDSLAPNQQILASDDEEFGQQLLEQMTEKERKQLLKQLKKEEKRKKRKKEKKNKQKCDDSGSDLEPSSKMRKEKRSKKRKQH